jgi:hypothetical protein
MHPENFIKYKDLREQHPEFIYESYHISLDAGQVGMEFVFRLGNDYTFRPTISIPYNRNFVSENLSVDKLRALVFNIGLVEMISYWKAACPPRIIIKPHLLDARQVAWWQKLFYQGLGEFFYRNGIEVEEGQFVEIVSQGEPLNPVNDIVTGPRILVPVGGGKDSVVTLEVLKKGHKVIPFAVNPRKAIWESISNAGLDKKNALVFLRKLDPGILELNNKGYLNGHTPFSALIAFTSVLGAALTGSANIALSNESSANESTVRNTSVNHQYSKSFEFETDFRQYCELYLNREIQYFSFLRPLNELQIVRAFTRYSRHHHSFRSCNVGSKMDVWCCSCPKCLFAYIMMSAFMERDRLLEVFGEDLFENKKLIPVLDELTGLAPEKPFECVGTRDEVNLALIRAVSNSSEGLPPLLDYYRNTDRYGHYKDMQPETLLDSMDDKHYLSKELFTTLKASL